MLTPRLAILNWSGRKLNSLILPARDSNLAPPEWKKSPRLKHAYPSTWHHMLILKLMTLLRKRSLENFDGQHISCFPGSCWRRMSWGCSRGELPWQQPSAPPPPQLPAASLLPTFPYLPVFPFHILKWPQPQQHVNLWSPLLWQGLWSIVT